MKEYGSLKITLLTYILLIVFFAFIVYAFVNRRSIIHWGRYLLFLFIFGLVICCFATMRDGWYLSIQHQIEGSGVNGLFSATGLECILGGGCALLVLLSLLISVFVSPEWKRLLFFSSAGILLFKIIILEIDRLLLLLR